MRSASQDQVELFERDPDPQVGWRLTQTLTCPDPDAKSFGRRLVADGNRLLVEAKDNVYLFERRQGHWLFVDRFGPAANEEQLSIYHLALHKDHLVLVLGNKEYANMVHIYAFNEERWAPELSFQVFEQRTPPYSIQSIGLWDDTLGVILGGSICFYRLRSSS